MKSEKLIQSITDLYGRIDACVTSLVKARIDKDEEAERKALSKMEALTVATMQEFTCIRDHLTGKEGKKRYTVILLTGEHASGDFMQEHACESHTLEEWTKLAKDFADENSVILSVKTRQFDTEAEAEAYIQAVQDCDEYNSTDFYTFVTIGPDRIKD